MAEVHSDLNSLSKWYLLFLCGASFLLPWSQRFFLIFLRKEIKGKPRSGDNDSRKRRGEREKPFVILASNLTSMQTTAVKRVKLLIQWNPALFKPNVTIIESFYYFEDPVNATTSVLRPGFYGPTVVALTGFHCNI